MRPGGHRGCTPPRPLILLLGVLVGMLLSIVSRVRRTGRSLVAAHLAVERLGNVPPLRNGGFGKSDVPVPTLKRSGTVPVSPSSPPLQRTKPACSFVVPIDYDYSKSTRDYYQAKPTMTTTATASTDAAEVAADGGGESYGPYRTIRDRLDRAYHGAYTRARQCMQDDLVHQVVDPHKARQSEPWIVFTAGAMGAGKSRTIKWMHQRGIFPLDDIVHIDSDIFKTAFPEWPGYVARDPLSAGYHTRHESGYLVEIAQEAALTLHKHIWVDGSLRDCAWYKQVFRRIRNRHPAYQIAILYVTADEAAIVDRVHKRAAATGRHVPEAEIRDSLRRVPQSVEELAPCAEFLAVIDNSRAEPRLTKYCEEDLCYIHKDGSEHWVEIEKRFRTRPLSFARALRQQTVSGLPNVTTASGLHTYAAATGPGAPGPHANPGLDDVMVLPRPPCRIEDGMPRGAASTAAGRAVFGRAT